ncbi:hypothetical protein V5O48_004162 [Marasmius crinis-equi]|uniref:Uncharacterized protein n=1 Tax=Marasmius crinis-equi TaxID=585013 RepID=A0ABR3FQU9_9AGAR
MASTRSGTRYSTAEYVRGIETALTEWGHLSQENKVFYDLYGDALAILRASPDTSRAEDSTDGWPQKQRVALLLGEATFVLERYCRKTLATESTTANDKVSKIILIKALEAGKLKKILGKAQKYLERPDSLGVLWYRLRYRKSPYGYFESEVQKALNAFQPPTNYREAAELLLGLSDSEPLPPEYLMQGKEEPKIKEYVEYIKNLNNTTIE